MKKLALILASTIAGLGAANAAADGATVYNTCLPCHGATGAGIPGAFPPLAESEWVNGPIENLIRIQLRGLIGPISVKGKQYNSAMGPNSTMSDDEIAAVLTHVRSSFGNTSSAVTADQVKALRSEVGKPMLKAEELIDPNKATAAEKPAEEKPTAQDDAKADVIEAPAAVAAETPLKAGEITASGKVTKSEVQAGPDKLVLGGIAAWSLLCIIPLVTGFGRKA